MDNISNNRKLYTRILFVVLALWFAAYSITVAIETPIDSFCHSTSIPTIIFSLVGTLCGVALALCLILGMFGIIIHLIGFLIYWFWHGCPISKFKNCWNDYVELINFISEHPCG